MCSGFFKFTFPLNGRNSRAYKIKKNRVKESWVKFLKYTAHRKKPQKKHKTKQKNQTKKQTTIPLVRNDRLVLKVHSQFSLDF